jgi:colicin import membrane protein
VLAAKLDACAEARAERDEARKAAAEAREQAARLAGQLEALQQQK